MSNDASFLGELLAAHQYEKTGVIRVRADNLTTFIYVLRGVPVFAEEGTLGESLGRVMLREGLLDQGQYSQIITRMTDSVFDSEQMRFGEVAVALGFLTLAQVNDALAEQVRRKTMHCLQWQHAECEFSPNVDALDEVPRYPCNVEPLVLDGLRRYYDEDHLEPLWRPARAFYPALADTPGVLAAKYVATPGERAALDAMDGTRKLAEVAVDVTAARMVAALLVTQGVTIHATAREARDAGAPHDLVRVPVAAKPEPAPAARPDPRPAPPAAPAPPKQVAIHAAPAAKPQRARPSIPPEPEVQHARLRAEQAFQAGKRGLRAGAIPKALDDLVKAATLHPDALEYQLYANWAIYLTANNADAQKDLRAQLKKLALRAVREDRNMAFAHYVHGQLSLLEGDEKAALRSFRLVHRLDPSDLDAERHLRILVRRGVPEG